MNTAVRARLGRTSLRLRTWVEIFRSSMFFYPVTFVAAAVGLAALTLSLDSRIDGDDVPLSLASTVASARAVLGTIAGATITVAGITFSVTVVAVQLAASQLSPRVMRQFLRDRFQQSVVGLTVGTFTYALLVLRSTRAPGGEDGEPIVPNLSVTVAVVLAVVTVIAILAFIDRSARSMQAGQVIRRVTRETLDLVEELASRSAVGEPVPDGATPPERPGLRVDTDRSGWVQQIDDGTLLAGLPPGTAARLETRVGMYVVTGEPLATLWPPDDEDVELGERAVQGAFRIGRERTMAQDLEFGSRQLVDIALRALSPGINDPSTAYEAIVHLGEFLGALMNRPLPASVVTDDDGRTLFRPHDLTGPDFVARAFDQIRTSSGESPDVAHMVVLTLRSLEKIAGDGGHDAMEEAIRAQIDLTLATLDRGSPLVDDRASVYRAAGREVPTSV